MRIKEPGKFVSEFINAYIERGFGTLSKREVDVLLFYLLLQDGQYNLPTDIYKACRELKLTETKVRNLYQDVQLKHNQFNEEEAINRFIALVENENIECDGSRCKFVIRDPLLRQYFEEWVAECNGFADSSFNRLMVILDIDLLKKILEEKSPKDFHELVASIPKEIEGMDQEDTKQGLIGRFVDTYVRSLGKEAAKGTVTATVKGLKWLLLAVF